LQVGKTTSADPARPHPRRRLRDGPDRFSVAVDEPTTRRRRSRDGRVGEGSSQVIALNDKGFCVAVVDRRSGRSGRVRARKEKPPKANGREFAGPVNIARRATLGEISFVVLGADDNTSAQIAASAHSSQENRDMEFTQWIESQGFRPMLSAPNKPRTCGQCTTFRSQSPQRLPRLKPIR
jgi:hypothetical protein